MPKSYGDRLTVNDISSPFESFGMTEEYKQGLVDKYNSAMFGDDTSSTTKYGALGGASSGDKGVRDINASKYAPGKFSFNTNLDLPTYKSSGDFVAPRFTAPNIERQLGDAPKFTLPEQYKVGGYEAPDFYAPKPFKIGGYSAPQYKAPVYNEGKVKALTQEQAAPAVRGLRNAIIRTQNQMGENENVNRMTMRDALAGYGQGLQSAMSGASATARGLYNEEYAREADAAKTNFEAAADASKTSYMTQADAAKTNYLANVDAAKTNFEAQADASKTSYLTQADAAKTNYLANVDAAKRNFEAQYDKYKMKWQDLSDAAKMNYTSKYNEAMQNWQAKQEEGKLNYQNLVDAKKLAYTAGMDVAKTNFATQADWKKTQYGIENSKAMAEYDAALKKYLQETQIKSNEKTSAPGIRWGGREASTSNTPGLYGDDYLNSEIARTSNLYNSLYGSNKGK
jgi:hypothetical protein